MGRIKGTAVINAVKALRLQRDAALRVLPESLRRYVDGPNKIIRSNWYPDDDFLGLIEAVAQIIPDPGIDGWEWAGRTGAQTDFAADGSYSAFIKAGDPGESLRRFREVWPLYHDSGEVLITADGERGLCFEIDHYLTTHDTFCRLQAGHLAEIATIAGAATSRADVLRIGNAIEPARWRIRWTR